MTTPIPIPTITEEEEDSTIEHPFAWALFRIQSALLRFFDAVNPFALTIEEKLAAIDLKVKEYETELKESKNKLIELERNSANYALQHLRISKAMMKEDKTDEERVMMDQQRKSINGLRGSCLNEINLLQLHINQLTVFVNKVNESIQWNRTISKQQTMAAQLNRADIDTTKLNIRQSVLETITNRSLNASNVKERVSTTIRQDTIENTINQATSHYQQFIQQQQTSTSDTSIESYIESLRPKRQVQQQQQESSPTSIVTTITITPPKQETKDEITDLS